MTKPESIRKFDMLYLGSLVVTLVGFVFSYSDLTEQVRRESAAAGIELGGGVLLVGIAFSMAISLLLWFLISKKRIEFVKWILILLLLWSLVSLPQAFGDGLQAIDLMGLASTIMQVIAAYFLFRPDAKAWFKGDDHVDGSTFD